MGEQRFEKAKSRLEQIYKSRGVENVDAEREAVAFYIQKNFGNQQFLNRMAKYSSSLLNRMLANARSYFDGGSLAKLENMFMKAVVDSKNIVDVSIKNGSVAPVSASIGTWEDTDVEALAEAIKDELNKDKTLGSEEVTSEEVQKWIDSVSSVAKMIADDIDRLGYVSNSTYSAMKTNSDYKYTIDMSTLCKKRLLLQGTIDAVQRAMPNTALTSMDYITIRELMAKKGLEVSCGFCYVESARRFLGKVAEEFIEKSGHTDVSIADLITVDGVENLQKTNPKIYEEFVKFNKARGQQRAMLVQTRTEYRGEIRTITEGDVAKLIKSGGLRLQSYSDFETPHLIDMMQVVLDMASRGLTSQAYTKVPNFADAFGNTNIKINLSLVCKGLDENGELIFDDVEGMPHEEAFRLREKYSKNVGTILVGKDDATILSAMADPRIDYIIPFHRSGWAKEEFEALGINGYDNYTNEQHEKLLEPRQYILSSGPNKGELSKPTKDPEGGDILPLSYWDFNKTGRENAVTYLELCREQKRIPKFYRFLEHHGTQKVDENGNPMFVESGKNKGEPIYENEYWTLQPDGSTDGYWKTLIDFKMYDNEGNGSPQERVVPIFDDEVNRRILNEYQGGHRTLRSAEDVVQEFLRMKSPNAQYSIGYDPENTWDDYDSDGNVIPENLSKYMVGSKLTNGEGQLIPVYHTTGAVFEEFDPTGSDHYRYGDQVVVFVSTNKDVSGSYSRNNQYEQIKKESDLADKKSFIDNIEKHKSDYYKAKEELDVLGNELDEYVGDYLNRDDVQSALREVQNNFNEFAQRPLGMDDGLADMLLEDLDTDVRQVLNNENGSSTRFRILSDLYDVYDNGKYNFYKDLLGEGVEFEVPQEIRDLLSPLVNISNELLGTRENRTKRRDEIKKKTKVATELYETWQRAKEGKPANDVQYVGYAKVLNPYVLKGKYDIFGRPTNWNSLNTSDYLFTDKEVDMRNVAEALFAMKNRRENKRYKQARGILLLDLVNDKNREYMLDNPIFLANLMTHFDSDNLRYLKSVGDVANELSRITDVEEDSDLSDKWDEVFDLAIELAETRGYDGNDPFEQEDWKEAKRELGLTSLRKFDDRLETNDVVKAVLAINEYVSEANKKGANINKEPYDGVIFKNITDSGNGLASYITSDIVALFNSNQFKTVGNENPTSGKNMFYSLGEISDSARKAVEEFGTTDEFNKAGYILSDGSLLDLSEGQDRRVQDHRSVGFVYDDIDYGRDGMSAGLIRFMNEGNVRILPESGSVDISSVAEPTSAQYRQIANFLRNYRGEWHALDVSYEDGAKVFSMQYPPFTPVSRVIDDIKNYFADGTIPEMDTDSLYQYSLGDEVVPANDGGGNDVVPPNRVEGEVVDDYGEQRTQRFASSNIPKSQIFSEEQQKRVEQEIAEGMFTYYGHNNKVDLQRANEYIERDGIDTTYDNVMKNENITVRSVVLAEALLQRLAQAGDQRWHDVAEKMADDGSVIGQALQAYSILQRLTPDGQLRVVQRNMRRMQQQLEEQYGRNAPQLEIKPELADNLANAKTAEEAEKARDAIQKDLISQMPITISSMIDAWRYLAMLGNPRTHVRNILGNFLFSPIIDLKNAIATVMESAFGGKLEYKTKAILTNSEADKKLLDFGGREYEDYKSLIEKKQKYERKSFTEKTFLGKGLNKLSNWNSDVLDAEDFYFTKRRYAKSFAQFLKANNLTEENITAEMRQRANAYALLEAEKATFRDANAVASWLNELEKSGKKGMKMASYIKKAVLPFTKTPMNIIKRGVRYSPAGLVGTIVGAMYDTAKGKEINPNKLIDNLASGMSGTAVALLGLLLTSMGFLRTKDDDNDRKNKFDAENGEQDYSLDLSWLGLNGTYTIDWMSPAIMPLAMGSELYKALEDLTDIDGVESVAGMVADIVSNLMDPVVETTMLSSLKDTMKSYSTSGADFFGDVLLAVASNYVQQLFPSLGGQLARTIDDTRRTTYPNKGFFDKTMRQIRNKVPVWSMSNEPYINKQGQEEKTEGGNWFGRLVLNTLSPGYYSSKDIDEYDNELYRLYGKTGEASALPSSTSSALTYDNHDYKFSPEEYTEWHKTRYATETKYVNSFIDSAEYKNLSDEEKVATIKDIRSYAQLVAKKQFLESKGYIYTDGKELAEEQPEKYVYDKQLTNASGALDNGIELYSFYDYLNNAGTKQAEKVQYLSGTNLTQAQKDYLWGLSDYKTSYADAYSKVMGGSSSKKKSSSKSKNGSSKKVTSGSAGGTSKVRGGGTISKLKVSPMASNPDRDKSIANNYFRAYANTFRRGSKSVSSASGNTVVCPRCGNRVSNTSGRCPVCGQRL